MNHFPKQYTRYDRPMGVLAFIIGIIVLGSLSGCSAVRETDRHARIIEAQIAESGPAPFDPYIDELMAK